MMGPHGNIITQEFDSYKQCDNRRVAINDEARQRDSWVGAVCWEKPLNGRFNYR